MNFLFKFPSRGRPQKFKETLQKHIDKLSNNHKYHFVFAFDNDDFSMNNNDIKNFVNNLNINYEIYYGDHKSKIEAINSQVNNKNFDILVLIADDMIPILNNYDELIIDIFNKSEHGLNSTIHFNTARWSNLLDIWCIMGKDYYKRFNYIYHPNYKSIFCDNEYTAVAKMLDKSNFSEYCPFDHDWLGGDITEQKNWMYNHEDYQIYISRKQCNFDLDPSICKRTLDQISIL